MVETTLASAASNLGTDPREDSSTTEGAAVAIVEHPEAPDPTAHLAIDPEVNNAALDDADSAVGSVSTSVTTSLSSSIRQYVFENGRRYHAYRQGEYVLPNDDTEQDRLDLTHHTFQLCLDGVLFRAPINSKPQHVLDLGTGTGIWAIQFADEYPSAQVIGTDLSPIQPSWVPPNCRFLVDDMESEWIFSDKDPFDLIHGRTLGGSVRDWPKFFRQAYDHLKPGGWVEIQEFGSSVYSDDDPQLLKVPNMRYWTNLLTEVGLEAGKDFDPDMKTFIAAAGFINVHEDVYKAPVGRWSKDSKLKELGMYVQAMAIESVEPYTLAILTRARGWTVDECRVLIAKVHQEMKDRNNHVYDKYCYTYGQKPPT